MSVEHITRRIVIWGIFLVPFLPFFVVDIFFFPFITTKNFAFRILVELLFGGWLILALYNIRYRPYFSWLLASIVAFIGIVAVADIFGENPLKSVWSNFERMEGLVTLIHLLAYFLIAGTILNTEKLWSRFLHTSVGVSVYVGFYGLLQLAGKVAIHQSSTRLDANFGNATYLAAYMLFHVFITAMLLLRWKGTTAIRWVYAAIIALQLFIIYYTASRGTILGLLGGIAVTGLLIALFARKYNTLRIYAAAALGVVVLVVGGFFLAKDSQFVKTSPVLSRFSEISISDSSVNARFLIWRVAWEGVKEKPFIGWGQENFNYVFNKYYDPLLYPQEQWFDRVHNIVFDWLIAGGILGFLAYVSIFLTALFYLWRKKNTFFVFPEKAILTGLLAGYTFHNLFVFDNIMSYILFFTILAYMYWSYRESTREVFMERLEDGRDTGIITRVYVPLIVILALFSVYLLNTKPILASHSLLQAIITQPGNPAQLERFEKTISYGTFGNQEAREHLTEIATRVGGSALDIETKQSYLSLASAEMKKQTEEAPNDARTYIFLGTLLDSYGQYIQGEPYLKRANELSPQKQTIMFQLGLNILNRGNIGEALAVFKEAFNLAPSYPQARIFYAVGAIYAKEDSLLEELLLPVFGTTVVDNDRLMRAYFNNNRLDKVLEIWQLRVKEQPENSQVYLGLAATYLGLNERTRSIEAIQKVIELDPNFKEQGEYYINEIRAGRNP
ncbi:O-antigen ligase family protein [Candidatus Kaiserbacteria bacterium]|nr:O-antigen ligase family protein [Candidatus Kaiserbacteria bacterium]